MSKCRPDHQRAQARDANSPPNGYDETQDSGQSASFDTAECETVAGTIALLRFDIDAARAAIRYRDERIAALEASLRDLQPPADDEGRD